MTLSKELLWFGTELSALGLSLLLFRNSNSNLKREEILVNYIKNAYVFSPRILKEILKNNEKNLIDK